MLKITIETPTSWGFLENLYKPDTTGSSMGALLYDNIAEITIEIPTINKKLTVANVGTLMAIGERKN